ncbi:MAG: 5-formyltetrahydrofolate cyclo-ligase [Candidatus Hadarchaeales archaeon]
MDKRSIRDKIREIREGLPEEDVIERSRKIAETLLSLPEFSSSARVALYVSKPGSGEVETADLIEECLRRGKRVLVPYVERESKRISLAEIGDPKRQLIPGAFGIPEPIRQLRKPFSPGDVDLVVVPGIAFDLGGNRLGHGLGYYDRLLREISSANPKCRFVGLAYDFQVLNRIPSTSGDVPVHVIVTETRTIRIR